MQVNSKMPGGVHQDTLAPYIRDAWEHYAEEQILAAAVFVFLIEASN